jgi:hypothetical protein
MNVEIAADATAPLKQVLLDKAAGHRRLRVELSPYDGKLVVAIGLHRERDGRGVWLNVDVRDLGDLLVSLEKAHEIVMGDAG